MRRRSQLLWKVNIDRSGLAATLVCTMRCRLYTREDHAVGAGPECRESSMFYTALDWKYLFP
jgi:hypothetical protein